MNVLADVLNLYWRAARARTVRRMGNENRFAFGVAELSGRHV